VSTFRHARDGLKAICLKTLRGFSQKYLYCPYFYLALLIIPQNVE
jgi:hypothetical protein